MNVFQSIQCENFPCGDVVHLKINFPHIDLDPWKISIILISEAAPADLNDHYYADGAPHFQTTTVTAFRDAGEDVSSIQDILDLGVYLTTAVKCGKTGYGIRSATVKECSLILEKELAFFPNVKAYLLMGDTAIKAVNYISLRTAGERVVPAASTYKIRGGEFWFRGGRAFPSYLQVGPSFNIEKSKRRMIAEDIAAALALVRGS